MKQLSPRARSYLDALRSVDAPPADASARVWESVATRAAAGELGPELGPEPVGDGGASAAASGTSIKSIVLGVVLGASAAIGTTVAVVSQDDDVHTAASGGLAPLGELPAPIAPVIVPPSVEAPIEIADDDEPVLDASPAPTRSSARAPTRSEPKPAEDTLPIEVGLLADARTALGAGEASKAIKLLARHRKQFPSGILAVERDVSWITALCVLGRVDEARTKAQAFLRAHGSSPHAAKVRASCGGRAE
jgi:hypothetical protein